MFRLNTLALFIGGLSTACTVANDGSASSAMSLGSCVGGSAKAQAGRTPKETLEYLMAGNARFRLNPKAPNRNLMRVQETAMQQNPIATIVSCSDSRVPSEIIFDQGIGDLFMVRTAGQVATFASYGSIEFGIEYLKTHLVMVLGHTHCGAVRAAMGSQPAPGHIQDILQAIRPAVEAARALGDEDQIEYNAVVENVKQQVKTLRILPPLISESVARGDTLVVGAVYDIETGAVRLIDE